VGVERLGSRLELLQRGEDVLEVGVRDPSRFSAPASVSLRESATAFACAARNEVAGAGVGVELVGGGGGVEVAELLHGG
jgi:hypothetical protein